MQPKLAILSLCLLAPALALAGPKAEHLQPGGKWTRAALAGKALYATIKTTEGNIVVRLFPKEAPVTVANFVGLAAGEIEWVDPKDGTKTRRPLYRDVIFHRVIPGFMVQTGDPTGSGAGRIGFMFHNEVTPKLRFDRPGLLAMANAGPGTNTSQFFITVGQTPHLNDRHTIFGEVISGYRVVERIATTPRGARDRPVKRIAIESISVSARRPGAAKKAVPKDKAQ